MNKALIFESRLEKLRKAISDKSEALLLSNEKNIGYFCGFFHSEGYLLVTAEEAVLFVDFRYYEAAVAKSFCCTVVCFKKLLPQIADKLKALCIERVRLESAYVTVADYRRFKSELEKNLIECAASGKLDQKIAEIRRIKDSTEIDKILTAQQITEKAYLEVLNYLKPGASERGIALELEHLIKLNGGEEVSFSLITITGKKTSLPHGVPGNDIVSEGDFFTFDIGSVYEGYHSDTTRTVAVKRASSEMREIYQIVLKAQFAALKVIRPGVLCSDVDKAARDVIEKHGYGKYFGHATGHGVGLDIHESPAVSANGKITLRSGMVITDEPGIYLPNKFGVRIEDMVCVTESGYKNFVTLPKELVIV